MAKIQVRDVYKIFGDSPDRALELLNQGKTKDEILEETGNVIGVNNATFDVEEGEIFVVMGLSGSGKSTLVRLLNRLIDPTFGTVEVEGEDITKMPPETLRLMRAKKMSMVFQRFALFPHRTVLENAAFGLEVQEIPSNERFERARDSLQRVGLGGWESSFPGHLSGGMQQRVGLARALATNSDIMLMDEAFSALDPLIKREMQDQLLELQSELKKTIIFITHDLNEAMKLGDHIAVMKDGEIVQLGTAEEILSHPANDYVASFVQDVDRTRVIVASSIMRPPRDTVHPTDGPSVALHKMREVQVSEMYVAASNRELIGMVRDRDLAELARRGDTSIDSVIRRDVPKTDPDSPIAELYHLSAEHTIPIAVVDDQGRLTGVIPRVSLLAAVGGEEVQNGA